MTPQGQQKGKANYERKDADVWGLGLLAGALLLGIVIILLSVSGLLRALTTGNILESHARDPEPESKVAFPSPGLQVDPARDLRRELATEGAELDEYEWVNKEAGIARIPIRRAMQLIMKEGLPEVGGGQTRLQLMQSRGQMNTPSNEPVNPGTEEGSPSP